MPTIVRMNPARAMYPLAEAVDRLFDRSFVGPALWRRNGDDQPEDRVFRLPIDAYATGGEIIVQAAFPGLAPESVSITVEGDTLTLSGELPGRLENVAYEFAERPHGKFSRTLTLNVPVDADKAEAKFENGLLTVTLPKIEAVRPKAITVTAK